MVKTQQLTFRYPNGTKLQFPDMELHGGDHALILGESGVGKTTLLQLISGLRQPTSGKIEVKSTDLTTLSKGRLDTLRGRQIGIVFQTPHFIQSVSAIKNVLAAAWLAGKKQKTERAQNLLDKLGIGDKADKLPQQLSQGEQQRLSIARALYNKPSLILADEPTSALDDSSAADVVALLKQEAQDINAVLLIITHDNRLKPHFDQTITLDKAVVQV